MIRVRSYEVMQIRKRCKKGFGDIESISRLFGRVRLKIVVLLGLALALNAGTAWATPQDDRENDLEISLRDRDPKMRLAAARDLIRVGKATGFPTLAKLLLADSMAIRVEASLLLQVASGEKFGYSAGQPLEQRRAGAVRWLRWANSEAARVKNRDVRAKTKPVQLFDGKGFAGWQAIDAGQPAKAEPVWRFAEGIISCDGQADGYLRTEQAYQDYVLSLEWRWPQNLGDDGGVFRKDSGVFIMLNGQDGVIPSSGLEAQLYAGRVGDFWGLGDLSGKINGAPFRHYARRMEDPEEKPLGEWNRMEILVDQGNVSVFVNGSLVNTMTDARRSGRIGLQVEQHAIEFRNVQLTLIDRDGE